MMNPLIVISHRTASNSIAIVGYASLTAFLPGRHDNPNKKQR
jgi:hypothetical protein